MKSLIALILFFVALPSALPASTLQCRNLAETDSQGFPARLELSPSAREFKLLVTEKGTENSATAKEGHSYFATRLGKAEEARYGVPSFYVSDNPEEDRFANDERDTATHLFLEPAVLEGKEGKIRLWLHYRGDGYQGEEENSYACK